MTHRISLSQSMLQGYQYLGPTYPNYYSGDEIDPTTIMQYDVGEMGLMDNGVHISIFIRKPT